MTFIAPAAEMPLFNLHSPKLGTTRDGEATLEFGYSQTRPGRTMHIEAVVRLGNSALGDRMIFGAIGNSPSTYILRLPAERLKQVKSEGVEILFIGELSSSTGELSTRRFFQHHFKLSNSLLLGAAGERATTRESDPADREAIARWLDGAMKQDQFEANIPAGFTTKLSRLVPGMTICVFIDDGWKQVEYLGRDADDLIVYRPDPEQVETAVIKPSLVSAKLSELEHFTNPALRKTPIPFKPSLRLMEESSVVFPAGYEVLARRAYVPGLPVKVRVRRELRDGFVVSTKYAEATVRYLVLNPLNQPVERIEVVRAHKLLAAKSDLALLETPEGKATLAANLTKALPIPEAWKNLKPGSTRGNAAEGSDSTVFFGKEAREEMQAALNALLESPPSGANSPDSAATSTTGSTANEAAEAPKKSAVPVRTIKRYPIQTAIPRGMQIVTPECPLQPGVQLGCSWGSKWYPVTVLELYDDGAVRIRWNTFGPGFDADQTRQDLIVSDPVFKQLRRFANASSANPRQWTDTSGQFKVIARFVELDSQTAVLQKPNQEKIRVGLDKLSEEDQKIIAQLTQDRN